MKKILLIVFLFAMVFSSVYSQKPVQYVIKAFVIGGDTTLIIDLPEYGVNAKMTRKIRKQIKRNERLVYNVKKVYPYARLAGIKLNEYEVLLKKAQNDIERKKLMKQAESELRDQFEGDIRKLTFTQGIILIKLIDRETGNSSYSLIQELRGKFTAFFWQTLARIFDYNLKEEYDPTGRDKDIEEIVVMIEHGQI